MVDEERMNPKPRRGRQGPSALRRRILRRRNASALSKKQVVLTETGDGRAPGFDQQPTEPASTCVDGQGRASSRR